MPLPAPTAKRTPMHVRSAQLDGDKRRDGCPDIAAQRGDAKDHDCPLSSGLRKRGDAIPNVGYGDRIVADYSSLIGLNLFQGFRSAVKNLFRSTRRRSQVSERVSFLPTAALQTFASDVRDNDDSGHGPFSLLVATRWRRIRTRCSAITGAATVARSPGGRLCLRFVAFVTPVTLVTLRNLNSSKESA